MTTVRMFYTKEEIKVSITDQAVADRLNEFDNFLNKVHPTTTPASKRRLMKLTEHAARYGYGKA